MGTHAFFRLASILITAGAMSLGCQWKGEKRGGVEGGERGGAAATQPEGSGELPEGAWRPVPVSMRVYPSSRFVQEGAPGAGAGALTVLEARIELLDEMGDTIKGSGKFHFELAEASTPGSPGSPGTPGTSGIPGSLGSLATPGGSGASGAGGLAGQRLYAWDVPVTTLEEQRQYWDPITRTYQFRLKMNAAPPPNATVLRAMLTPPPPEGRHITAEAGIRR